MQAAGGGSSETETLRPGDAQALRRSDVQTLRLSDVDTQTLRHSDTQTLRLCLWRPASGGAAGTQTLRQ